MNTTQHHTYTHTHARTHSQNTENKSTCERTERVAKNTQEYLWVVALKKSFGPCTQLKWELYDLLSETQHTSLCLPVSGLPTVCIKPVVLELHIVPFNLYNIRKDNLFLQTQTSWRTRRSELYRDLFLLIYHTHFCTTHNPLTVLQKRIQRIFTRQTKINLTVIN